jgi:hypothetical protein
VAAAHTGPGDAATGGDADRDGVCVGDLDGVEEKEDGGCDGESERDCTTGEGDAVTEAGSAPVTLIDQVN